MLWPVCILTAPEVKYSLAMERGNKMTGREIIKRVIENDNPPRIGFNFISPEWSDIDGVAGARLKVSPEIERFRDFDRHGELLSQVPGFSGDVKMDALGNIYGRLGGRTKGECIKGAMSDWGALASYRLPELDMSYYAELKQTLADTSKFVIAGLPFGIFSAFRDARLMPNALMDTIAEPENAAAFLDLVADADILACGGLKETGADAVIFCDDWGTQDRTFISPDTFEKLFLPAYTKLCQAAHSAGLKVILHSCGKNNAFMSMFAEAGIDSLQFDQQDIYPLEWLADNFAGKINFYLPVDIQTIMTTGNRELIKNRAKYMTDLFRMRGASIIAKDYPTWGDIGVREEWAEWAREAFIENA